MLNRKRRDEVWENTFNAIKAAEEEPKEADPELVDGDGGEGGSHATMGKETVDMNVIVNSDSKYRKKGGAEKTLLARQA